MSRGQHGAAVAESLPPAGDARALVVVRGHLGAPGAIGQVHQGEPQVERTDPHEQVQVADAAAAEGGPQGDGKFAVRHEEHPQGEDLERRPDHHPGLSAPERRAPAVGEDADGRVRHHVGQPRQGDQGPYSGEREAKILGIERRNVDCNRQADDRGRQIDGAVESHARAADGLPGGGLGHPVYLR